MYENNDRVKAFKSKVAQRSITRKRGIEGYIKVKVGNVKIN